MIASSCEACWKVLGRVLSREWETAPLPIRLYELKEGGGSVESTGNSNTGRTASLDTEDHE